MKAIISYIVFTITGSVKRTRKEEQEKINMRRQEFWNEQIEVFRKLRQEGEAK